MKTKSSKQNNTQYQGHPKYWLSGQKAKLFRRKLSRYAGRKTEKIVLTHKFPLVAEMPDEATREILREEYRLSSAVEENTLFHFFAAFHLAGFRVFTSRDAAMIHRNRQVLRESDLNAQLIKCFDLTMEEPAQALLQELGKGVRGDKSKEGVVKKIAATLGFDPDDVGLPGDFARAVACEIADGNLWGGNDKQARYDAIVSAGKSLGLVFSLPSLSPYDCCVLWDGSAGGFLKSADASAEGLEFAMHQMVSLAAHIARKNGVNKVGSKHIKEVLLSDGSNYNGLDWLLNEGVSLFAKEKSDISGMDIGGCSDVHLDKIRAIAKILENSGYEWKKHRSIFGGNISSATTNYVERLVDIKKGLDDIKMEVSPGIREELEKNQTKEYSADLIKDFESVALPLDRLQTLIDGLVKSKNQARKALDCLMGEGDGVAGKSDVEEIERFNDHFYAVKGLVIQMAEKIRSKEKGKKGDFSTTKKMFPDLAFLLPVKKKDDAIEDDAARLGQKINRYNGARVLNMEQMNRHLGDGYNMLKVLLQERSDHWQRIGQIYGFDIIASREGAEKQCGVDLPSDLITELACRNILHRLANTVKRLGDSKTLAEGMLLFEKNGVFADKEDGGRFFNKGKGRIYVSPYKKYRHQALSLGKAFNSDIRSATKDFIDKFICWSKQMRKEWRNARQLRDAATIENGIYGLLCGSVRGDIKSSDARPSGKCELNLSVSLEHALQRKTVTPGELGRIFNAYASEINGLCAMLVRKCVISKSRLQHIGDKVLCYVPKTNRDWSVSERLFDKDGVVRGDCPLSRGWRILQTNPELFVDGMAEGKGAKIKGTSMPQAIDMLADSFKGGEDEHVFRSCLRQIPHNWCYQNSEYPSLRSFSEGDFPRLIGDKGGLVGLWKIRMPQNKGDKSAVNITGVPTLFDKVNEKNESSNYIRLSGTSCHKGWLDDVLIGKASLGDSSLIIEEEYTQLYDKNRDEFFLEYDKTRLEIAAVVKYKEQEKKEGVPFADRFIAIDLGERGIGYAVYEVPSGGNAGELGNPVEQGHVIIPILRHLMRRVDTYRRREQPRQRFNSNLNTSLQQMREATVGELAGVIDGLMMKHKAFPVFESSVGAFETGGNMLKMVYGSILQLYLLSDVDAHKTKRKHHWQLSGEPIWNHPFLKRVDKNGKALSLFPGTSVHPAWTSQTCSHYQQNPLELINKLNAADFPIKSDDGGILTLPGGKVQLYVYGYGEKERKGQPHNVLPRRDSVMKNHSFMNQDDLLNHFKKMLRLKPLSAKSKDTSQSTYLSPFVDTQEDLAKLSDEQLKAKSCFRYNGLVFMHADINAAINIGRKWWGKINSPGKKNNK